MLHHYYTICSLSHQILAHCRFLLPNLASGILSGVGRQAGPCELLHGFVPALISSVGGRVRIFKSLIVVSAVAATATALTMAPAMADPVNSHYKAVTPKPWDIIAVGSQTTSYVVDQLAHNYDASLKTDTPKKPFVYSWDAVPPNDPLDTTSMIVPKSGCASILRPDGSSNGIAAVAGNTDGNVSWTYHYTTGKGKHKKKHTLKGTSPCWSVARSSRAREGTDPAFGPGGISFVPVARDAITYATTANSNAPANLTTADLTNIFNCTYTTWNEIPGNSSGSTATIDPILPQSGSGTLSTWVADLGLGSSSEPVCSTISQANAPEENEGVSPDFLTGGVSTGTPNPNVIYPFSIGSYISQAFHSAACGAKPSGSQNQFGCNETGVLNLRSINGTAPTSGSGTSTVINPAFSEPFFRVLYDVVPWANNSLHIPTIDQPFLGPKGYFCKQTKVLADYGYLPTELCGFAS
jgi:ABC-type phosphate transport system substrate-binding protein